MKGKRIFVEAMTVARNFSGHTISRGTDYTDALALSIVGCIQPKKLLRLLNEMEKGLKDDGLLQDLFGYGHNSLVLRVLKVYQKRILVFQEIF